jgi:hypothetical protein
VPEEQVSGGRLNYGKVSSMIKVVFMEYSYGVLCFGSGYYSYFYLSIETGFI